MSADCAPGTVAVITHDGDTYRAVRDDKGWASLAPEIGWVPADEVTDVRPLVVLDPDHPSIRFLISRWHDIAPGEAASAPSRPRDNGSYLSTTRTLWEAS